MLKYDEAWLDFICASRIENYETNYDIIYDRIADNRYKNLSNLLLKYHDRATSAEYVIKSIKPKFMEDDQYCFKTNRALRLLGNRTVTIQHRDPFGEWYFEN